MCDSSHVYAANEALKQDVITNYTGHVLREDFFNIRYQNVYKHKKSRITSINTRSAVFDKCLDGNTENIS